MTKLAPVCASFFRKKFVSDGASPVPRACQVIIMFPKFSYSRLQLYILYIYHIYIHTYIYIWDLGILGSCHVLQEAVGRVFGTRRSHGTGHPHVIWHERSATFFRRSRCHAAMLSSHWDPAEFQLSLNGDTLSHT